MKKIIIVVMCMFCTMGAYAENEPAATSKEYVDAELATKQPTVPAQGNNVVMTFDSTATDGIGTKNIYDPSGDYASQQRALVTAATANSAVQMAINGEFYCKEWSTIVENDCWLWGIKSQENSVNNALPSGYTKLEYLESNVACSLAYIDTGINFNSNYIYEIKFSKGGKDNVIMGARNFTAARAKGNFSLSYEATTCVYSARNSTSSTAVNFGDTLLGVIHTMKYQQSTGTLLFDNTDFWDSEWLTSFEIPYNIYLFAVNKVGVPGGTRTNYLRIYSYSVKDANGAFVQKLIPARQDGTGNLGMYDTVTNTFFTNAGTGTFVAGPTLSYLPQNVQSQ